MSTATEPTVFQPPLTPANGIVAPRAKEEEEAPALPKAQLWAFIPKEWRPTVAIILLLLGTGSGAALANVRAIWGLPEKVAAMETTQNEIKKTQDEMNAKIDQLIKEAVSRPK